MRYRSKYEYTNDGGISRHVWTVIGRYGAVHLHISDLGENWERDHLGSRYSGGLELHYREPPCYMRNEAPTQDKCWLLDCPCWSDGSSVYAQERLIPLWQSSPTNHDRMFGILQVEYRERFDKVEEAA